ncbi:MAG TPA: SET domain-containing protein-lysine N-methyltransferase [Ohtaekwangia sp.]|nr:SET domain-containing protein-lysine N-methyltransferase [Ohtaekwangia sp.]
MALLEKQLYIKKSNLPNAGMGLFTKKFIPKGTRIVEYKGRISTWKDIKDEDGKNGYIFYVTRNHVIDALPHKKALARYANDARGLVRIKGMTNNCDYITDGKTPYIESKRDIPAGGEILVDYGQDYWKVIRENLKLFAQEAKEEARKKKAEATNGNRVNGVAKRGKVQNRARSRKKVNGTARRSKTAATR